MFATLLRSLRLPFLVLTPACVLPGVAAAVAEQGAVGQALVALIMLGALSAHISVNTFNEYLDFRSGLDLQTRPTPFSGGSGALPANPAAATLVHGTAWFSLLFTIGVGLYLIQVVGLVLLPLGVAGVALVLTYTSWLNRNPFLCVIAPGLGFGPFMVMGTQVALTGEYSWLGLSLSLVPFFLVNNLLLLNQYPDLEADRDAGRNHFPIAFGIPASNRLVAGFAGGAVLVVLASVGAGAWPLETLLALLPLSAAFVAWRGVRGHAVWEDELLPCLGANVVAAVVTPLVLGLAFLLS